MLFIALSDQLEYIVYVPCKIYNMSVKYIYVNRVCTDLCSIVMSTLLQLSVVPSVARIWQHLLDLVSTQHSTIIVTTHYIEEARQASVV